MNPIINFQFDNGLTADGIIGRKTIAKMCEVWKKTRAQVCVFLGQCHVESAGWTDYTENLNYSAQGLADTWPSRYAINPKARRKEPNELARRLARNPEAIANHTYADRMGNKGVESGDGWKYRGRGAIMTTGAENYRKLAAKVGNLDILNNPGVVATDYQLESALFYFDNRRIWDIGKDVLPVTIKTVTKLVQGGDLHLDKRIHWTNHYYNISK